MNDNKYQKYQIYLHKKASLTYLQALSEAGIEMDKADIIDMETTEQLQLDFFKQYKNTSDEYLLRCKEPHFQPVQLMVNSLKTIADNKVVLIKTYDDTPFVGIRSNLSFVIQNLKTLLDVDTGYVRVWDEDQDCGLQVKYFQSVWRDPGTSNKRGPYWQYELNIFGKNWLRIVNNIKD